MLYYMYTIEVKFFCQGEDSK